MLVGERPVAPVSGAIAYADAGDHELKGKTEPAPLWRALRVVAQTRVARAVDRPRGAVRRPRRRSSAWSRISSTRPAVTSSGRDSSRARASPGSASHACRGSSRSTSTASRPSSGGIAAVASPTATGSRSGRSRRWCAGRARSSRTRTPRRAPRSSERSSRPTSPTPRSEPGSSPASASAGSRRVERTATVRICSPRGGASSSGSPSRARWCLSSRICTGPTKGWSPSSSTCSTGPPPPHLRPHARASGDRGPPSGLPRLDPECDDASPRSAVGRGDGRALTGLVPGPPDDAARAPPRRADGVPLYAVETVRMLRDRGLLEQVGDEVVVAGDLTALEVPETLHALIASRLDAVPDSRAAAARGRVRARQDVHHSGPGRPFGARRGEVDALVSSLVRKELLAVETDPFSPERGQLGVPPGTRPARHLRDDRAQGSPGAPSRGGPATSPPMPASTRTRSPR